MNIFFFFQVPINFECCETFQEAIEKNRSKKYYISGCEEYISGCSTYNVGIANVVLKSIGEKKFDKIVFLYDKFERDCYGYNDINTIVKSDLYKICESDDDIISVNIHNVRNNPVKILETICKKYPDLFIGNTIYVSANSGNRNSMMSFLTFAEVMSSQTSKTKAFYTERENDSEIVSEITLNKEYFQYLRSVEIFIETGNPTKLRNVFINNTDSDIEKLFILMEQFHTSIQLCQPRNEHGTLKIYKDLIDQIAVLEQKYKTQNISTEKKSDITETFRLLIPVIKSSFARKRKDGKELIQITKWCIQTNNIALGYFILNSEIVGYLQEKNIIKHKECISNKELTNKISDCINYIIMHNKKTDSVIDDFGFDCSGNYTQLENALYIYELTKRIRKSLAHSSDGDLLYYNDCLFNLLDRYEKSEKGGKISLYTCKNESKGEYSLKASDSNYFNIIKKILICIIDDIDKFS